MRKIFTKLLSLAALCLLCTINARAASDEKGNFIYYAGTGGYDRLEAAGAEYYEDWKLYETAPGSNVYARLFTTAVAKYSTLYFKFYTELSDNSVFWEDYYRRNLIAAVDHDNPESYELHRSDKSGIYTTDLKSYRLCTAKVVRNFVSPKKAGGYVYIVVDLNNGNVSVIPAGHYLMVLKDQPEPDFGNLTDYISAYEDQYFEPGDYEFNMYSLDAKINNLDSSKWVIPSDGQEVIYDNEPKPICDVRISSHSRDSHFVIRNWPGGIIRPRENSAEFTPDNSAAQEDVIYVNVNKKPFLPWAGCSEEVAQTAYRLTKNGDKYTGTFRYDELRDGFNLIVEPGAKEQPATKVLCPPTDTDIRLTIADDCSYAPVAIKTGDEAAYWLLDDWHLFYVYDEYQGIELGSCYSGHDVNIEVTPGDKPSVKIDYNRQLPNEKTGIYLRGDFTEWQALSSWEFVSTYYPDMYIIQDVTIPVGDQFKVADSSWGYINFGSNSDDSNTYFIYPGGRYNLNTDINPGNIEYYGYDDFHGDVLLFRENGNELSLLLTPTNNAAMDDPLAKKSPYYIWDNNFLSSVNYNKIQGLYEGHVQLNKGVDELALNLFAKMLPYDSHDELWAGSWAINAPYDNYVLEFDEYGIAESFFTVHEGLTTEKPAQFILRPEEDSNINDYGDCYYKLYIDKDAQKLYVNKCTKNAIFGSFTDYEIPTIKNREKFANYYLPYFSGGLFDFPKGDVDYTHSPLGYDAFTMEQKPQPDFTVNVGSSGYVKYNWTPSRVIVKDWKGGEALIAGLFPHQPGCGSYFIDASIINEFNFIGWEGRLIRENADSNIYKGEVTVDPSKYPNDGCWLNLQLSDDDTLSFGQRSFSPDFDENGKIIMKMGIGRSISLYHNRITEPCKFKATFDLKMLELELELIDGQLAEPSYNFELVANAGSDLDGKFVSAKDNDDCVSFSGTVSSIDSDEISFNMISSDGQIVAPTTDTEISFDSFGYWEGKSVDMTKSPARMRTAARKAADASAKWHFQLPADSEGTELVMEYDITSNTIRIHSSAHNENFFIVKKGDVYNGGIDDLIALKENTLEMTSDGIFEGEINLTPTGQGYFSEVKFSRGVDLNHTTTNIVHLGVATEGNNNPTLSDETPVVDFWAWNQDCCIKDLLIDANWWKVTSTRQNVRVKFDASNLAMQYTIDTSGVEDVIAERKAIVITAGNGTITFTTPGDVILPIYSISGATIKVLNLSAGTTTINIAPGYYIADGQKIMVR